MVPQRALTERRSITRRKPAVLITSPMFMFAAARVTSRKSNTTDILSSVESLVTAPSGLYASRAVRLSEV